MVWWCLSDYNVFCVEEEIVFSFFLGVFMFFYDCVDLSMVVNDEFDVMQDVQVMLDVEDVLDDDVLLIVILEFIGDDDDDGGQIESEGFGIFCNFVEVE